MKNILITGYTGFVGRHLLSEINHLFKINLLGRSKGSDDLEYFTANIDTISDYSDALNNVDVVVHMAARVHVMN